MSSTPEGNRSSSSSTLPTMRSYSSLSGHVGYQQTPAQSNHNRNINLMATDQLKVYTRRHQYPTPNYSIIHECREDLQKFYTIRVQVNLSRGRLVIAEGQPCISRRLADESAAKAAIYRISEFDSSVLQPGNARAGGGGRSRRRRQGLGLIRSLSLASIRRSMSLSGFSMRSLKGIEEGNADQMFDQNSEALSLEGVDSIADNCSCYSNSANAKDVGDGGDATPKPVIDGHEHDQHDQINHNTISNPNNEDACSSNDEGVCSASNLSSPHSTAKSSPSPPKEEKTETEIDETIAKQDVTTVNVPKQSASEKQSRKKDKSLSISFLQTLRRSFRRPQKEENNKNKDKSTSRGIGNDGYNSSEEPQPSSSGHKKKGKFKVSMPSPKTIFSSTISIESSDSNSSSTSGSYTMEESNGLATWAEKTIMPLTMTNGFNGGYKPKRLHSVIAEEDEENEVDEMTNKQTMPTSRSLDNVLDGGDNDGQAQETNESSSPLFRRSQSSRTLTASSGNSVDCLCGQKHFTVYGRLLCSHQRTGLHRAGETEREVALASTAVLARYCVLNFLSFPFYDMRTDQSNSGEEVTGNGGEEYYKFYTTCRVTMSPSRADRRLAIPEEYRDHVFTTKGSGRDYREARLVAAQRLLDKLKQANLLPTDIEC